MSGKISCCLISHQFKLEDFGCPTSHFVVETHLMLSCRGSYESMNTSFKMKSSINLTILWIQNLGWMMRSKRKKKDVNTQQKNYQKHWLLSNRCPKVLHGWPKTELKFSLALQLWKKNNLAFLAQFERLSRQSKCIIRRIIWWLFEAFFCWIFEKKRNERIFVLRLSSLGIMRETLEHVIENENKIEFHKGL